jgi:hypothetical protein
LDEDYERHMTTIVDIADAVLAELGTATFSKPFVAQRAYRPLFDLAEMKDLHVTVVPKGLGKTLISRGALQSDYLIDVAVQQKPESIDNAALDALMVLVAEIAKHFEFKRLSAAPVIWIGTDNAPIYSPEHLEKFRQFTSVLTLTFRGAE